MTASRTFSLGGGISNDDLVREGLSVTDICFASTVRWRIGRLVPCNQMAILSEDSLGLEMPRVMQRIEQS